LQYLALILRACKVVAILPAMISADVYCTRRDVHFCGGGRAQGDVGVGEARAFSSE
jgi:hypothetical protein